MAQDSRRVRYIRRLKRQNTLFFRENTLLTKQRDFYRNAVIKLGEQLEAKNTPVVDDEPVKKGYTITRIPDETEPDVPVIMEGSPAGA